MRAGPAGIRAAPRRAGRDHLRRERRTALLVRRRPRPRARLALRGRQRARPPAGAFQDRHAGRLRCRGHAGRRLRAGALLRYAARTQSQALAHVQSLSAERPVRAAGPGHAPQPGTDPDPVGRGRAHAVLAAGRLPRPWAAGCCGAAASPAARERAGAGAPARHLGPAGRPHGRGTDLRRRRWKRCAPRSTPFPTSNASPRGWRCARCARASWPACATRCTRCPRCASWSPHVVLAAPGRAAG